MKNDLSARPEDDSCVGPTQRFITIIIIQGVKVFSGKGDKLGQKQKKGGLSVSPNPPYFYW